MPKRKVFSGQDICDLLGENGFVAVRQILDGLRGQLNLGQDPPSLRLACSQETGFDFPAWAWLRRSSKSFWCSAGTGRLSNSGRRLSQRNSSIFHFSAGGNAANSAVLIQLS